MRKAVHLTLLVAMIFPSCLQAQKFYIGPEMGMAIPLSYKKRSGDFLNDSSSNQTIQVLSPFTGLSGHLRLMENLHLGAGIQFQRCGQKEVYLKDYQKLPYNLKIEEYQKFYRFNFPISVYGVFALNDFDLALSLTYRPCVYVWGKNHYHFELDYGAWGYGDLIRSDTLYSPFNSDDLGWPAKRFTNQIMIGVSLCYRKNYRLNIFWTCWSDEMKYSLDTPDEGYVSQMTRFRNREIVLSFTYLFPWKIQ